MRRSQRSPSQSDGHWQRYVRLGKAVQVPENNALGDGSVDQAMNLTVVPAGIALTNSLIVLTLITREIGRAAAFVEESGRIGI